MKGTCWCYDEGKYLSSVDELRKHKQRLQHKVRVTSSDRVWIEFAGKRTSEEA